MLRLIVLPDIFFLDVSYFCFGVCDSDPGPAPGFLAVMDLRKLDQWLLGVEVQV